MPRANCIFGVGDSADDDEGIMPLVQGYTPAVFRMDMDQQGPDIRRQGFGDKRLTASGTREARG